MDLTYRSQRLDIHGETRLLSKRKNLWIIGGIAIVQCVVTGVWTDRRKSDGNYYPGSSPYKEIFFLQRG